MQIKSYSLLIVCDGMHAPEIGERPALTIQSKDEATATKIALEHGWTLESGEADLCPHCSKSLKGSKTSKRLI